MHATRMPPKGRRLLLRAATRPRTCSARCASSAASTARARRSRRAKCPRTTTSRQFIARIERTDKAFQRDALARQGRASSRTSTRPRSRQPPIPGTVLLFTAERLRFTPDATATTSATCRSRQAKFLIIDGQHRLAALQFYLREASRRGQDHPRAVRDLRRHERGLRHRDVRHHQLDADAHQQEPPRRPLRARLVGGAGPQVRGARGRDALRRGRQPAALPDQPPRRPQPAARSGSCRRSSSTRSTAGCAASWRQGPGARAACAKARPRYYGVVRDFLKAARTAFGDALGQRQLHGHQAGDDQGDDARVRRPRARRRRARRGGRVARWEERLAPWTEHGAQLPRRRASTSASRRRARSSASRASTASSPRRRRSK